MKRHSGCGSTCSGDLGKGDLADLHWFIGHLGSQNQGSKAPLPLEKVMPKKVPTLQVLRPEKENKLEVQEM